MNKEILKYGRQLLGLSQMELADMVVLDRSTISKYEAGTLPITPATAQRLLTVFVSYGIGQKELNQIAKLLEIKRGMNWHGG